MQTNIAFNAHYFIYNPKIFLKIIKKTSPYFKNAYMFVRHLNEIFYSTLIYTQRKFKQLLKKLNYSIKCRKYPRKCENISTKCVFTTFRIRNIRINTSLDVIFSPQKINQAKQATTRISMSINISHKIYSITRF